MTDKRSRRPRHNPYKGQDGVLTRGPKRLQSPFLIFGALALIFLGVFALTNAIGQSSELSELRNGRGVVVEGTAVDVIKQSNSRSGPGLGAPRIYTYCPEYRFETLDGDIYRMEADVGCSEDVDELPLGAHAEIIYDATDPTISYVNSATGLVGALVMGGGALLAGVAMIGAYIWIKVAALRRKRQRH